MNAGDVELSVVVPCYRNPRELAELLQSLAGQAETEDQTFRREFEVIVVDSGRDERVVATAERFGAGCVRGEAALLPGEARNLGAREASGRGLAFVDSDCVAGPGWIAATREGLEAAVMVGGPVLNLLPWYTVASADNLLQFADFGTRRPAGPIRHVPSCNMAVRRDDFFAVGGFEHRGQLAGEDVLLTEALNALRPGGLTFVPAMRVAHVGRRGLGEMLAHQRAFGYARGALGLHLTESQRRWAALALLVPAVAAKHLSYVCSCGLRYGQVSLPRLVVLTPLLALGAFAWALGLRAGLKAAAVRRR